MTKQKPTLIEQHINMLVRERRAPPCPRCDAKGSLAGGDIGEIRCNRCQMRYETLKYAWKVTLQNSLRRGELNSERKPEDDP